MKKGRDGSVSKFMCNMAIFGYELLKVLVLLLPERKGNFWHSEASFLPGVIILSPGIGR